MNGSDKAFEDYLEGKSGLSRQYAKLGDSEPPPDLDAAILAEAEKAVKVRWLPAGPRSWMLPVSVAATVMICFSLVLNVLREVSSVNDADQHVDAIVPADPVDRSASIPEGGAESVAPDAATESSGSLFRGERPAAESYAVESPGMQRSREYKASMQTQELKKEVAAGTGIALTDTQRPADFEQEKPDAPMRAGDIAPRATDSARAAALAPMMEIVTGYLSAAAGGADELAAPSEPGPREDDVIVEKAGALASSLVTSTAAEKQLVPSGRDQVLPVEPDNELRRIAELYAQSQNRDAAEALAEFRTSFPDHPVSRALIERGY